MIFEVREINFQWSTLGLLVVALSGGALHGCRGDSDPGQDPHVEAHSDRTDFVDLGAIDLEEFGLGIGVAGPAVIEETLSLTGEVRSNNDRVAHIVPRYGGIVKRADKNIGDKVRSGDTLAVVESSLSLSSYSLKTMIDGVVIKKHVTLGEAVDANTQAFVVADLSTVWVDLDVYMRDLHRVKAGQTVFVEAIHGTPRAEGVISYVTPIVSKETRTATARIVLENEKGLWHPGMFTTAKLLVNRVDVASAVPKSAIHSLGDEIVVFVVDERGYQSRSIPDGLMDRENVEVSGHVAAGERVVFTGGFTVKSEMMRTELSAGHGH